MLPFQLLLLQLLMCPDNHEWAQLDFQGLSHSVPSRRPDLSLDQCQGHGGAVGSYLVIADELT